MQKRISWMALSFVLTSSLQVNAQDEDSTYRRWFVGSTLYLLGNFDNVNNPEYVQLNAGYRITPKDVFHLRFTRSVYAWPLGITFGPSFDAPGQNYPGHARILIPKQDTSGFGGKEPIHPFML